MEKNTGNILEPLMFLFFSVVLHELVTKHKHSTLSSTMFAFLIHYICYKHNSETNHIMKTAYAGDEKSEVALEPVKFD